MTSASDEKWSPFNCFFSRVGLRTYQHPCTAARVAEFVVLPFNAHPPPPHTTAYMAILISTTSCNVSVFGTSLEFCLNHRKCWASLFVRRRCRVQYRLLSLPLYREAATTQSRKGPGLWRRHNHSRVAGWGSMTRSRKTVCVREWFWMGRALFAYSAILFYMVTQQNPDSLDTDWKLARGLEFR
jgi:hypothetical protein